MIFTLLPLIKVTATSPSLFMISVGAKVISDSLDKNPIGLNFSEGLSWNFNKASASDFVKDFPLNNFFFTPLNDFGKFSIGASLKKIPWGLVLFKVTSPLNKSIILAADWSSIPRRLDLNFPLGSAKKDLSISGASGVGKGLSTFIFLLLMFPNKSLAPLTAKTSFPAKAA